MPLDEISQAERIFCADNTFAEDLVRYSVSMEAA